MFFNVLKHFQIMRIIKCRSCQSTILINSLDLGNQALTGFFQNPETTTKYKKVYK